MFKTIKTAEQLAAEKKQQEDQQRIQELKRLLTETDYVALADYDKEKPELITQRQEWRDEIRQLMYE
jgi:hypothetical protein